MKRVILFLSFSILVFCDYAQEKPKGFEKPLVVFLVRHAEKVDQSRDPELSDDGKLRAETLAETLKSCEIEFIHSTDFIRTKNTAKPAAELLGLEVQIYDPRKLKDFSAALKKIGGRHLVVGHSNTTPALVEFLGGNPGDPIYEKTEYDRLYIITIAANKETTTVLLRIGDKYIPEK